MLSAYHEKYARRSDEDIALRAKVKEAGLTEVLAKSGYRAAASPVRVAVLGCAERRFVRHHRDIFARLLGAPVELTTFDITTEHLEGEEGVVRHDIAEPLPGGPFDVAYGDVVLKFLPEGDRLPSLVRAYEALRAPGIVIHILDDEDALPAEAWKAALEARGIACGIVPIAIEGVLPSVIRETALYLLK
ncbi:MAG TPA: hypothetical protein VJ694_04740 [Patescibacteria group bacterium]|nr:hypothetical protein [Patescibacteria group bacterium]